MLDVDEMESLYKQVCEKLREKMFLYNRDVDSNALLEYLKDIGMEDVLNITPHYETYKQGKIVIIGQSSVEKNIIYAIIKELGIDKSRVELCLDYDDAKTFNFKKLRYNPSYRVVLVGSMPHSTSGKVEHSSSIAEMEQEEGYPRVVRLTANEKLKITKTNLKETLKNLLNENYL
jgi:hypothetical protein